VWSSASVKIGSITTIKCLEVFKYITLKKAIILEGSQCDLNKEVCLHENVSQCFDLSLTQADKIFFFLSIDLRSNSLPSPYT